LANPQADAPIYFHYQGGPTTGGIPGVLTTVRPGLSETGANNFGPEVTFARTLADHVAGSQNRIALIKYANGGTNLHTQWKGDGTASSTADGSEYKVFQSVVTAGLAALAAANPGSTIQLAGMTWVQGESDIDGGATTSAAYGANLTTLIADVRATLGAPNLPFFFSRISDNQTNYSAGSATVQANYNTLRAGQATVAATVTGAYMLDTDPAQFSADGLHYDTAGQQALGTALANAAISAGAVPEPSGVALVVIAGSVALGGRRRKRA
ncbi:MAG TPA: sialate O-acetylesterase, partial [Tepidisphaeraceae bacterium]|nr:sialate O-acetylesterase [Tepidisphaeraceae bacterium]